MHSQQIVLAAINVVGGIAVLGSYAYGIWANPAHRGDLWGGVPEGLKPLYVVSMLLAALGYFAVTYYILFRLEPDQVRIADRFGFVVFPILYAIILAFSALWLPLTFAMLGQPSTGLWVAIRLTLAAVGLASLALLVALLALNRGVLEPEGPYYWLAVAGSAAFCLQTSVLDMLVWPAYFRT
jgi:hypothetical protein